MKNHTASNVDPFLAQPFRKTNAKKKCFVRYSKVENKLSIEILKNKSGLLSIIFDILCTRNRWVLDMEATACQLCGESFGMLKRKHHCRGCGKIFCGTCSSFLLELFSRQWGKDTSIVHIFREQFKSEMDTTRNLFFMRLCRTCFESDLNDQLSQLYDEDGFARNLKQSFILNDNKMRVSSLQDARRLALHDAIYKEAVAMVTDAVGPIVEGNPGKGKNWIEEFVSNLFMHFATLLEHKLDFNQVDVRDLVPVVRCVSPKFRVEFYTGLILELDTINEETCQKQKNLPDILFVRRSFCRSKLAQTGGNGTFRYLQLDELQAFSNANFQLFKNMVEENDISIVISEFCLPARIHFFLNSRGITVISSLSASKMNLVERIIRSSVVGDKSVGGLGPEPSTPGDPSLGSAPGSTQGFEKISFEGLFDLKMVQTFEKKVLYFALFKKKNARSSFNSFSIIINCVYDHQTKQVKRRLKQLLPLLLYKFQEHAVVNTEMRFFDPEANYNFSKHYLKERIREVASEGTVGNLVSVDRHLHQLANGGMDLTVHTVFTVPMDEKSVYEEFRDELRELRQSSTELYALTASNVSLPIEFNSSEFLRGTKNLSFLANINLSKHSNLMRLCGKPIETRMHIMGAGDTSVTKYLTDLFKNRDAGCHHCGYKLHRHTRILYVHDIAVKLTCLPIEGVSKDLIRLRRDDDLAIPIIQPKLRAKRTNGFDGFVEMEEIRATYYCLDCEHIFENLVALPSTFQNLSLAMFLSLFVIQESSLHSELMPDSPHGRNKSYSLLGSFFPKRSDHTARQCFHVRMTRAFVQGSAMLTLEKIPTRSFLLVANRDILPKRVEAPNDIRFLFNLRKNFNFLIDYFCKLLKAIEEDMGNEWKEATKKDNLASINRAFSALNNLAITGRLVVLQSDQKEFNISFYFGLEMIAQRLQAAKEIIETTRIRLGSEVPLIQTDEICYLLLSRRANKNSEIVLSSMDNSSRLTEIQSHGKITVSHELSGVIPVEPSSSFVPKNRKKMNLESEDIASEKQSVVFPARNGQNLVMAAKGKFQYSANLVNYYARFLAQLSEAELTKEGDVPDAIKRELGPEDLQAVDLQAIDFQMSAEDEEAFSRQGLENTLDFCARYREYFRLRNPPQERPKERFVVKDYFPNRFEKLRKKFGISLEHFIHSLSCTQSLSTTGGRTGSAFYITSDQKYVIKEIKGREYVHFRRSFASAYVDYMLENSTDPAQSLICRTFALFRVNKTRLIVMENLTTFVRSPNNQVFKYDLKGSERNRFSKVVTVGQTLMDTNFKIERNGDPVSIIGPRGRNFWETLNRDTLFLTQHNVMDYSLLLILDITDGLCFLKIIDYLRDYDFFKIAENNIKKVMDKQAPTITKPADYRARFVENSRKYFIVSEKDLRRESEEEELPELTMQKTKSMV